MDLNSLGDIFPIVKAISKCTCVSFTSEEHAWCAKLLLLREYTVRFLFMSDHADNVFILILHFLIKNCICFCIQGVQVSDTESDNEASTSERDPLFRSGKLSYYILMFKSYTNCVTDKSIMSLMKILRKCVQYVIKTRKKL